MKIGNREFDVKNRTYIMGILNVTPVLSLMAVNGTLWIML